MRERPELEVVLVVPRAHHSWLEALIMRTGRIRFMQILQQAGVAERVAMLCPQVADGRGSVDVMVHSKVMVVDDSLLRVGSANLNNPRSGSIPNAIWRSKLRRPTSATWSSACATACSVITAA